MKGYTKFVTFNLLLLLVFLATFSFAARRTGTGQKRHSTDTLVAKFDGNIKGKMTFRCLGPHKTLVSGQFCSGFKGNNSTHIVPSPNGYKIRLVRRPQCPSYPRKYDLTPRLRYRITSSGGTTFMECHFKFGLDEIKDLYAQVSRNRIVLGYAPLRKP